MGRIIPAPQKKKRGRARPTKQVSGLQRSLLFWILKEKRLMLRRADTRLQYERSGVEWDAKNFYSQLGKEYKFTSTKVILSKSLARLEERGLIVRLKESSKTKQIRLTPTGLGIAIHEDDKKRRSQGKEEAVSKMRAYFISYYHEQCSAGLNPIWSFSVLLSGLQSLSKRNLKRVYADHDEKLFLSAARFDPELIQQAAHFDTPCDSEEDFLKWMGLTAAS